MKKFTLFALLFLANCSNSYKNNYLQSSSYNRDSVNFYAGGKPTIIEAANVYEEAKEYYKKGYLMVGESKFNSGNVQRSDAKLSDVAKNVGAEIVLWSKVYTNTVYNSPITRIPQETASYLPYSLNRYDYDALFLVRAKRVAK